MLYLLSKYVSKCIMVYICLYNLLTFVHRLVNIVKYRYI